LQQNPNKGLRLLPQQEEHRLLHPRKEAAWLLGISVRSLDYLIANKQLATRKIGGRVLIPHSELVRFSRADHFEQISKAA
jgi:excisionase family DNA binding protein